MASTKNKSVIPDAVFSEWLGLNTAILSAKDLKPGESPASVNWITGWDPVNKRGDHIELRRGMALLGDRRLGSGGVNGIGVGIDLVGNQVPFWSYPGNLMYYNAADNLNVQISALPAASNSDWFSIEPYQGIAGNFVYVSSPNSSIYKVDVSSPAGILDVTKETFQGNMGFIGGRMNLWNKNGQGQATVDKVDLFQSGVDLQNYSDLGYYPAVIFNPSTAGPAESVGTGNGTTKTFAHTLANQGGGSVAQVMVAGAISAGNAITGFTTGPNAIITTTAAANITKGQYFIIDGMTGAFGTQFNGLILQCVNTDGIDNMTTNLNTTGFTWSSSGGDAYVAETFLDNQSGGLISNLGGTGTINYVTGALSVTFNTAPINMGDILSQYYYQPLLTGVEDFTVPGSPGAGSAAFWQQRDGGGPLNTVQPFSGSNFCFHTYKTWVVTNDPNTYTNSTNIPYRNNIGTPFYKSAFPTGDGIIFVDTSIPAYPKVKMLAIAPNTTDTTIEPLPISDNLDLTNFGFQFPPVTFWNQYNIFACQNILNGTVQPYNGAMFIMNTESGYWDQLDYQMSLFAQYYGTLIAGSSISNNVYTLFSGFDDDGAPIANFWNSSITNLGWGGLKTTERFVIEGLMQPSQSLQVYVSYDQGPFTLVQTINGTDACVSQGNQQLVGSNTVGSQTVGAGSVYANPFLLDFSLNSDYYNYIQVQFVATGIGYIEIDKYTLKLNHRKTMELQSLNSL